MRSGSIVRSSMPAFRVGDPGPNPGRSTPSASGALSQVFKFPQTTKSIELGECVFGGCGVGG